MTLLDWISQKITAICVVDAAAQRLWQCPTNPEQITVLVRRHDGDDACLARDRGRCDDSMAGA